MAVNPVTNKIYVADSGNASVTVIDGFTNETTTLGVGDQPVAVAVNPVTNRIYVVNYGSASVTVIVPDSGTTYPVNVGTQPRGVAVNPVTNKIYVTNYYSGTMTVIDGATSTVDTTVAAGTNPRTVAANPITNKIYVTDWNSDSVTVIDGATNGTARLKAGANPYAVAVNPVTNKIYVANYTSADVTVIDGATNGTAPVTVGSNPRAVAVNPVTNKIYVANSGSTSNSVTVIDGSNNNPLNVGVGTTPCAVAVNPVTNKVYVADSGSADVKIISGATNEVIATVVVGSGPRALAVNPVTNKIYVANSGSTGNSVTVIDGAGNTVLATVTAGTSPYAVAVNPVTNRIYVANYRSANVTVIDGATNGTTPVTVGSAPCAVAVNPITNKVYVTNYGSNNVTVIDGATNNHTNVNAGTNPCAVAVNPVTNKIYVANYGSANVTVIVPDSGTTHAVSAGTSPCAVAVNRVANKVYVANNGSANVTVIDGATNTKTTVTANTNPCAVAVNPVTNKTYVANWGSSTNNVTVITYAPNNDTKVHVAFDPSPGTWTAVACPPLTGTGSNSSTPNGNVMMGVGNRVNTAQKAWNWANVTSGARSVSITWTYEWGTDSLIPGENYVCAQPLESDAAITNNEGMGTPFAGNLLVLPIYRLPPDVGADCVLRPVASFLMPSWKIPPLVRIKNFGSVTQGPFNVRFTISPGDYTPSTRTVSSLAAGDTCTVEFDSLTLATGVFTAKCSTMLAGDLTSGNDVRTACFQGCTFIDFSDLTDGSLKPRPTTGRWTRGTPQSPWTWPPMDSFVWGNRLSGFYGNSESDTLTSPRYKASQNNPAIAFQHCYNTQPSVDGGNFAYSTDGINWSLPTPVAGVWYGGTVSALGQSGWSGTSGWNQSVFTIQGVNQNVNFLVRWRFASDGSNNSYYGWLIDEVAGINCAPTDGKGASGPGTFVDTVNVCPNLIRGTAQVNYTLMRECNVTIKLFDASGRLAARVPTSGFKKGKNTARLDASRLARGVYFVKVRGETDTRTTKVIIE